MTPLFSFTAELSDPAPISVNEMYSTGNGGRRFLTSAGRHYKDRMKEVVSEATMSLRWKDAVDAVYKGGAWVSLSVVLEVDRLANGSWKPGGGKTTSGDLRSPYRKMDGSNYIKIVEDAVVLGTGIDDSAHLDVRVRKTQATGKPRVVVEYKIYGTSHGTGQPEQGQIG